MPCSKSWTSFFHSPPTAPTTTLNTQFQRLLTLTERERPGVSGYAQGMTAGLYARAYNLTENETYLETARLFLNSFNLPLSQNGFVVQTKYDPWYLEYNYYPEQLVLNGHIITLQGLYYWKVTGDERTYDLFWEGAMSVKKALPDFDTGD